MEWLSDHEAVIRSLGSRNIGETRNIESILLPDSGTSLQFQQQPDDLRVQFPMKLLANMPMCSGFGFNPSAHSAAANISSWNRSACHCFLTSWQVRCWRRHWLSGLHFANAENFAHGTPNP
jgi:hypothetical protein